MLTNALDLCHHAMKDYMAHMDEAVDRSLEEKGYCRHYNTDIKGLKVIFGKVIGAELDI